MRASASCRLAKSCCIWDPRNMPSVAHHWIHHWPMKTFKVWRNFYLKDRLKKPRSGSLGNHSQECRLKLAVFFLIWKAQLFHKHDFHYITNSCGCSVRDIKQPSEEPVYHYTLKQMSSLTWLNYVIRSWFFSSLTVKTCANGSLYSVCWFILSTLASSASIMTENALR